MQPVRSTRPCPACGSAEGQRLAEPLDEGAYLECPACGLQYVEPLPGGVPVFQDFTGYAELLFSELDGGASIDDALTPNERLVLEQVERELPKGSTILEFCCESGRFLAALRARGYRVYGIDPLERPMALLRRRGFEVAVGLEGDIPEEWPAPDAIVILESLVRFPEPVEVLRTLRTRFPRARLYVSVPSPRQSLKLPEVDRRNAYPPHHLVRWSEKSLTAALRSAGYRAHGRTVKVRINWPVRRGTFGNTLAVVLRLLGEAEYSHLAAGRPA